MKVTIRIHRAEGLEFKTKKIDDDGKITLRRKTKDHPAWRAAIGTMELKHQRFGRVRCYADIFPNATESWTYNYDVPEAQQPKWDKEQSHKFIEAKLIEKAGQEPKEPKSNSALWIIAILIVVMGIVQILFSSGKIRIG